MGWINAIGNSITTMLETIRPPLVHVPALLLLCEIKNRHGLSAIALASAIIQRLPEYGIPTGKMPNGEANSVAGLVNIMAQEFVKEIHNNARVDVALDAGAMTVHATGGNVGGPIEVIGSNLLPTLITGLIR